MYDVIVVGGGVGGTGVAALLARRGFSVLLLEKKKAVGGRCSSYERDGFLAPTYVHAFARVQYGPCGKLARELDEDLEWAGKQEAIFNVRGKSVPIPLRGKSGMLDALKELKLGWWDLFKAGGMVRDVGGRPETWEKKFDHVDVMSWLQRHSKNEVIHSLFGFIAAATFVLPPYEGSTGEYLHIVRGMARAGTVGYPVKECQAVPDTYLHAFEKAGGELRKGKVASIRVEGGKVRGVVLKDGEFIEANAVISNAGVKTTTTGMLDEADVDPEFLKKVKGLKGSWSAMVVKVALDKPITDMPACIYMPTLDPVGYFKKLEAGEVPEQLTLWVTIPPNLIPSLGPPGKQLICAGTLLPNKPGVDWQPYIDKGFETLESLFPDIPKHTMWKDSVTPAQVEAWAGSGGSVFEVAQTVDQVGANRPTIESPIDGLFFVGADVGSRAVGVELAADSAFRCADLTEAWLKG